LPGRVWLVSRRRVNSQSGAKVSRPSLPMTRNLREDDIGNFQERLMAKSKANIEELTRLVSADKAKEPYLRLIRPTIEDPYEIWLAEFANDKGEKKFFQVYLGLYGAPGQETRGIIVMADNQDDKTVFFDMIPVEEKDIDTWRTGVLLYSRDLKSKEGPPQE